VGGANCDWTHATGTITAMTKPLRAVAGTLAAAKSGINATAASGRIAHIAINKSNCAGSDTAAIS
jgi:hypothetical protein